VHSLTGFDSPSSWSGSANVLVELAISMRAHGRGGTLLVVPEGTERWQESISRPIPYAIAPPYTALREAASPTPMPDRCVDRSKASPA
jgi:hypothetical protein